MTDHEKDVVSYLVRAWNCFATLPEEHPDDIPEFRAMIHRLQEKVLARPARREMQREK